MWPKKPRSHIRKTSVARMRVGEALLRLVTFGTLVAFPSASYDFVQGFGPDVEVNRDPLDVNSRFR